MNLCCYGCVARRNEKVRAVNRRERIHSWNASRQNFYKKNEILHSLTSYDFFSLCFHLWPLPQVRDCVIIFMYINSNFHKRQNATTTRHFSFFLIPFYPLNSMLHAFNPLYRQFAYFWGIKAWFIIYYIFEPKKNNFTCIWGEAACTCIQIVEANRSKTDCNGMIYCTSLSFAAMLRKLQLRDCWCQLQKKNLKKNRVRGDRRGIEMKIIYFRKRWNWNHKRMMFECALGDIQFGRFADVEMIFGQKT